MAKFKTDPYSNLSQGVIKIAKSLWNTNTGLEQFAPNRYKVSDEIKEVIGDIRFWIHEADEIISTVTKETKTLGNSYVLIYKE